MITVHTCTSAL